MCKYCKNDGDMVDGKEYNVFGVKMGTNMFLNPKEKEMVFIVGDEPALIAKIEYCPICGRKLNTD